MRNAIAIAATAGAVILAGGAWWAMQRTTDDPFAQCRESQIGTGIASIGGPLSLIDENGAEVTDAEMFTKPTLVYFGYTFCPDVCPLDGARNAEALDMLLADGYDAQMSFISVDPERDDPERLRDFTDYLHPQALGYTGTMEQIRAASQAYKTYFKVEEDPDPDFYLIDHTTFTYLVLPQTGFVEFFRRDTLPQDMANRVKCFIDNAG
jgi:protein SCO1/2